MKIIFLDIDGVLNSTESITKNGLKGIERPDKVFIKDSVDLINSLIEETGAKVIISSTWRYRMDDLRKIFKKNNLSTEDIIGKTPILHEERGDEIVDWLEKTDKKIDSFVIIDDDRDMTTVKHKLVHVDRRIGFTQDNKDMAVKILNN